MTLAGIYFIYISIGAAYYMFTAPYRDDYGHSVSKALGIMFLWPLMIIGEIYNFIDRKF